jgi:hypothetical protein
MGSPVLDITVLISITRSIFLRALSHNHWILQVLEMWYPEADDRFRYHDSDIFSAHVEGLQNRYQCHDIYSCGMGKARVV